MKKRRTLIISLLLVAALCLGIGYAAIARDLQINGSANLQGDNEDFDVVFMSGEDKNDMATVTVAEGTTTATYVIDGLSEKGEVEVITFVVKNRTTDIDAKLKGVTSTTGELKVTNADGTDSTVPYNTYFEKSMEIKDAQGNIYDADSTEPFILSPGEEATVTITLKLLKSVTNPVSASSFIALHFDGIN
jgi:hypothetical protein